MQLFIDYEFFIFLNFFEYLFGFYIFLFPILSKKRMAKTLILRFSLQRSKNHEEEKLRTIASTILPNRIV